jgi:hypothetical protein
MIATLMTAVGMLAGAPEPTPLTMEMVKGYAKTVAALAKLAKTDAYQADVRRRGALGHGGDGPGGADPISATTTDLESWPLVRRTIEAAGLSVANYARINVGLSYADPAMGSIPLPRGVPVGDVAFLRTHRAEIDSLMTRALRR